MELSPKQEEDKESVFKVGCINLTPRKKQKRREESSIIELVEENERDSLTWLKQKMSANNVSKSDQKLLEQFLETIDESALDKLVDELREANQVLSIDTLTSLPERAQEILAEALGISKTSISRMAKLSNRTSTLRIVIKSFLKTRKK